MAVDYRDLIACSEELFGKEQINRFLGECAENKIDAVQWRLSACGQLLYHTKTGDMFTDQPFPEDLPLRYGKKRRLIYDKCKAILSKLDPLETATKLARKHGLKMIPWLTLFDDWGEMGTTSSSFARNHPDMCWKSIDGKERMNGFISYAYPEAVEFRMRQIREILEFGDGIYLSNRSHCRPQVFNDAMMKFLRENPECMVSDWLRQNSEYAAQLRKDCIGRFSEPGQHFTEFLEIAAAEAKQKNKPISFGLRYFSGSEDFLQGDSYFDWDSLVNDGLISELHYLFPETGQGALELFPELSTAKCDCFGWLWLGHSDIEKTEKIKLNPILDSLEKGLLNGITLFEAFRFIENPVLWNIVKKIK
jgi:hypothetical protein